MKYGWDKIKVVTDNLNKWDDLQALWFDTCGYLLIWKWNDSYWTRWSALVIDEDEPCRAAWNCPICQEKIDDVADLPWRPQPCSWWDAFLMLSSAGKLKVLCKDNFICKDEKVKTSSWDWTPGYLYDKLKSCDSNWPISVREVSSWNNHHVCIWFDKTKVGLDIIDLEDWPGQYPSNKWLLVWSSSWWSWLAPTTCENKDYSYVVYNSKSQSFTTLCEKDMSIATWRLESDYTFSCPYNTTKDILITNTWTSAIFKSTRDINKWTWDDLIVLTRPWVYMLSMNITISNTTQAWLTAIRAWLTINWDELWDAKYDSRDWSKYMNEEYPNQLIDHDWMARELDLQIMSFDTTYSWVVEEADLPARIRLHVKPDTRVGWEVRHTTASISDVNFLLTAWASETWWKAFVSAVRVWDIPAHYEQK